MSAAINYRKYSDVVKSEVAQTGNIYLFPDLKIPRTTAQYWVQKKRNYRPVSDIEIESVFKKKSEFLESELAKEKSMRLLLETVRKVFPYDFREKKLRSKIHRAQIVFAIRECNRHHKLSHCLDAIGLPKASYRSWSADPSVCGEKSPCTRRQAGQITQEELNIMKKFVTSRKYGHVSVASLQLLAQRTGELFCSLDTWYKYVNKFSWKRPWDSVKNEVKKIGIRAERPNQIWHLDVTVVNVRPGLKLYIQAVIDNFSRFILAWRVTDRVNAENTIETLKLAHRKASEMLTGSKSTTVMMDPGKENDNSSVESFISSNNLIRLLAQVDIHYSNSMIERLFHSLKNNFLYFQDLRGPVDLERKANFYFSEHNNVIPMQVHKGGTPKEIFLSTWDEKKLAELAENKTQAILTRRKKNQATTCEGCIL